MPLNSVSAFRVFAQPRMIAPDSLSSIEHSPLAARAFSAVGLISRVFNYGLLGGTFPGVTGLMAGLGMGLGLDALVNQLDSHQFAHSDRETVMDHVQVGAVLGTTTVLKNAWLTTWKVQHPYHWTSKGIMVLDSFLSNQFRGQLITSLQHAIRNSYVWTESGKQFHIPTLLRLLRRHLANLSYTLSDPTLLRKRLGIKSMRNATLNFMDNGYQWFSRMPALLTMWKQLYMPVLISSSVLRATPFASRLHADVVLKAQHRPFRWRLIRTLPGLLLDMLVASVLFFGIHSVLHSGHRKVKTEPS